MNIFTCFCIQFPYMNVLKKLLFFDIYRIFIVILNKTFQLYIETFTYDRTVIFLHSFQTCANTPLERSHITIGSFPSTSCYPYILEQVYSNKSYAHMYTYIYIYINILSTIKYYKYRLPYKISVMFLIKPSLNLLNPVRPLHYD